jgi:CRISPR-associated protein Csb1
MSEILSKYDSWLSGYDGPAALVIREHLMPVEGENAAVFPPTFASGDGFPGGYNIDTFGDSKEGKNVCLIDSVGSQANRIEPIFAEEKYAKLIPQIVVKAGEKEVNILEAGHRAGDALVRCSELQDEMHEAFMAVLKGDAEPLTRLAPTSLVFGVWDSRDTQAKLPRLVSSTIRAFDVRRMTRGAVYIPPVDYSELEVFSEAEKAKAEGSSKNPLAQRGFVHNPASGAHGGVIATGGIRRDATLSIAALQLLKSADDDSTIILRRYVLGLALVALTAHTSSYLRQGCNLVIDPDTPREFVEVFRDGRRESASISHDDAIDYAGAAAEAFGVGESRTVQFDKKKAKEDVKKKD